MTGMRFIGTLLWIVVLLQFGALAVSAGAAWSWQLFLGCLSVFVALAIAMNGTRRSAQLR
jgi:membrane protein DedA with SNARE-associated domain